MSEDILETTERKQAPATIKFTSTPNADAFWYVVHTYSGHEQKVAITLGERVHLMDLADRINEVLIPTQKKIIISGGKKKEIKERMFPGYILVKAVVDDNVWHAIRSTPGVTGFVGIGNKPTPLSKKEVDSIIKFMKLDKPTFEAKFKEGDGVKVTDGAFKDFLGRVNKVMTDQGRLEVLVSIFDRETPVEVDFAQVEPV
ncbi:transcription termination/antitermination protein NusG [candidate division WWE3 bacterium CG_4_9_14_0_2_um_filter_35_11]|uniref:Transcription termination/antitermination protein NusG n=1 Tax=candidate division WWE3 bacterium CG_4_9_14_0_2_um_filter_35_11 TaxID=1975077 RepID=A0A2M8EM39_UNCKA|nr:MAG: transcription termination/antitermination protein NusG [candidate division WWE3 bacterium CG10_big_fil_rev_8_21_14_0_10_35_32]PJC23804.1 MAG: transcription termination/antitermination protein NusG [candidate division WWE3 bacterium CG_4_9_14_0_2_um_filter_35_11]